MAIFYVDQLVGSIPGEYQVERLLGHSQLGAAYLARQRSQGRTVMITTFTPPEGLSDRERDQITTRLAQERATLTRLMHPNILPIYECGEQSGSLYQVTAFAKGASLAQVLEHQGRLTPQQTLMTLRQAAAGLDYAHSYGAVHGLLSLSNVLIGDGSTVQIAGFGLRSMLEACGAGERRRAPRYLYSPGGSLLGDPAYLSPEQMEGLPLEAGADLYALGVMLFELLSDTLPFSGATTLEMALKRLYQPVPSLHAVCPGVPEALDLVLGKMLERDPAKRYGHTGECAAAFERVLRVLEAVERSAAYGGVQREQEQQITLPSTVNWYDEDSLPGGKWQLMPPILTGQLPAVSLASPKETGPRQQIPGFQQSSASPSQALRETGQSPVVLSAHDEQAEQPGRIRGASLLGIDPFAWWTSMTTKAPQPGTFERSKQRSAVRLANVRSRRRPTRRDRRKVVKLIATGTAVAGVCAAGGLSFARFVQSVKQAQQPASAPTSSGPATATQGTATTGGSTPSPQQTPKTSKSPSARPSPTHGTQPSPTSQPTLQPTSQPTPKPTQPPVTPTPSHTGTVIGSTSQSTNSARTFTNPADGNSGLLLHLSNGNFVACEQACTHAGVAVNYDAGSGRLVCPAHGAIFDPLNGFSQVPGAGPSGLRPLPGVTIRVNADGTITTG